MEIFSEIFLRQANECVPLINLQLVRMFQNKFLFLCLSQPAISTKHLSSKDLFAHSALGSPREKKHVPFFVGQRRCWDTCLRIHFTVRLVILSLSLRVERSLHRIQIRASLAALASMLCHTAQGHSNLEHKTRNTCLFDTWRWCQSDISDTFSWCARCYTMLILRQNLEAQSPPKCLKVLVFSMVSVGLNPSGDDHKKAILASLKSSTQLMAARIVLTLSWIIGTEMIWQW